MKALIQRVKKASVSIDGKVEAEIKQGALILLGIHIEDTEDMIAWLSKKVVNMRVFDDEAGIMNKSVRDIDGDLLIVSQFTLYAQTKKGNRPSYIKAAPPEVALPLYKKFVRSCEELLNKKVTTGQFGANMQVALINDGPVTIIVDSPSKESDKK